MKVKVTNGNPFKDWYFKYIDKIIEVDGNEYSMKLTVSGYPDYHISGFDCIPVEEGEEAVECYDFSLQEKPTTQEALSILGEDVSKAISNFELSTDLKVGGVSMEKGKIKVKLKIGVTINKYHGIN